MASTTTFCVAHAPPLVPDSLYDYAIGIGDYHPARGAHISTIDPYWHSMRECAYGAAGNYAIVRALDLAPQPVLTGIFSHRKLIARRLIGIEAPNYPVYREITPREAQGFSLDDTRPDEDEPFLIGMPIRLAEGLVRQYAEHHRAIDLYDYLSIAADIGVLSSDEIQAFSREEIFVPGGCELGIYPTSWLRPTLAKLEHLAREFLTRYAGRVKTYNDYQVRAIGFLAERLGSFLLLDELRRRYPEGIPGRIVGHLYAIVPEGTSYDAAIAS